MSVSYDAKSVSVENTGSDEGQFSGISETSGWVNTGSGKLSNGKVVSSAETVIRNSGIGDITMDIETGSLKTATSGTGRITLTGRVDSHSFEMSGLGDIRAFELETVITEGHLSGTGSAEINVSGELHAAVTGT